MYPADDELPWPRAGTLLLGRYELLGVIGRGGMGVVSRARDVRTGREVAVKRVRAADARAEREAMASARLHHPAIVELIDAQATDEGWIIVSELVVGADLRAVLRSGEVPELDIARFAGSIVRGLGHAHDRGVVHRDIKPANILCPADPRRAGAWAKLTDFGVAALAGAETLTAVGDVVGTMAYMAPEQARGDRADAPADVFSLAVVVYEALAGINPRRGGTAAETAARALQSMPPLARSRPDLPSGIHAAIDHCLELEPEHRGGLAELDEGLRRLAALASGTAPAPWRTPVVVATAYAPPAAGRHEDPRTAVRGAHAHAHDDGDHLDEGAPAGHPLVPYLPPPGHQPVGDPAAQPPDLGPHGWAGDAAARPEPGAQGWPRPATSRGRLPRLPLRLLGTGGACAALWVLTDAASAPPAVAAAGVAAFLLPRATWLAIASAAVVLLISRDATAAWLAALAGLAPVALLGTRGALWPAGGLAAGLVSIGGPGAWPALAALAPNPLVRLGLAIQGSLVAAAVATAIHVDVLDVPTGDVLHVAWAFVLPLAGIWAAAALLLGVIVRGRTIGADVAAAAVWAGALGWAMVAARVADAGALLWAGPAIAAGVVVAARAAAQERQPTAPPGAMP